ncbi:MAG: class I SAM-dependent methyltransferase [Dehalococcoidia bacterium]
MKEAAALDLEGAAFLRELTRLRRRLPPELAAAVLEQTRLRRRAAAKFSRSESMLFTPEGLEQASGERVAAHTAARYRDYALVADICCGIGGDTLALAQHCQVEAYDRDPLRLACAEHNAAVYGVSGQVRFHLADVETMPIPTVDAIFYDPGRRVEGRRIFALTDYRPPVSLIERWLPAAPAIGVKVAPGVAHDEVVWPCEQEFVAEGHDLKEALLWFGPLAAAGRRATLLPSGATLVSSNPSRPPLGEPLAWLYDPSAAVTRAAVIWELAEQLGARQLDPEIAYLTTAERRETPFARIYSIEEWHPFNLKRLKARLRQLGVGRVTVRKRGSPLDPEALERRLRGEGINTRVLILTRLRGVLIAIICRGLPNPLPPSLERKGEETGAANEI